MKTKALYLLFGLSAGLALGACTDNDVTESASGQKIFDSNKAYLVVNIQNVGNTGTRATAGNPEFEYGSAKEYAVRDAHFYFYNEDGTYFGEGFNWDGGAVNDEENTTIEFMSNTVVMLSGLEDKEAPRYVVTVLNKPTGFTADGTTLTTVLTKLASESELSIMQGEDTYFTMSTTSYIPETSVGENSGSITRKVADYYYATALVEDDFHEEPIEDVNDIDNPVDIYVERLAAKVTLKVSESMQTYGTNNDLYQIEYADYNDGNETDNYFYVRLEGWTLDATAKYSYMIKHIENASDWDDDTDDFAGTSWGGKAYSWNDPENFRSYWGESYNYEKGTYPTTSGNNTAEDEAGTGENNPLNEYLTYVDLNNPSKIGDSEYCGENTNTVEILGDKYSTAITNVLVKATICDEDGNGLDLIRCQGILYKEADYLAYALSQLKYNDMLNVWYEDGVDDKDNTKYSQIDASFVKVENRVDGYVDIVLKDDDELTEAGHEGVTFVELNADNEVDDQLSTDDVNKVLDVWNGNQGLEANGYKGGSMYYNIPIEHLNNDYEETDDNGNVKLLEANYGIVRNHLYYVTITEISGLGHGIYDPDEVIVPQNETPKYGMASVIYILSWKVVEQNNVVL